MPRPSWSGFLRFNLIAVPVKGYNATQSESGGSRFHMLHAPCHSRIKYKKFCPIHGEVSTDEIVSGFEVAKGEYAIVDKEERTQLKAEDDKTIGIEAFIRPDAVDPVYFNGRTYYLVPDGKIGHKSYAVLLDAMREQERYAIGQVVFAGRAQLALVRPCGKLLAMTMLSYEDQVKQPADFEDEVHAGNVSAEERKLAATLISTATADNFDIGKFKDEYASKLTKLVEAKTKRKSPAHAADDGGPVVLNLMEALRGSLAKAKKGQEHESPKKPARQPRKAAHAKRKTG